MVKRRNLLITIAAVSGAVAFGAAGLSFGRTWSDKADGFASVNALGQDGTTGGAGGKTVTVATQADLEKYAAKEAPNVLFIAIDDMKDPDAEWPYPAIMTQGEGNHALRTDRWRYIRYRDGSEELYDHENDPWEWKNLAGDEQHAEIIGSLGRKLDAALPQK